MPDISIFGTLNTGILGIYTHKLAMSVVAHNIANTNTEGFSRQRPVIVATPPVPTSSLTQPSIPLQVGTGSMVRSIERIRDSFLDSQYRQVNAKESYWNTISSNMHFVEQLFSEPGDSGIRYLYDSFWNSLQEVINDPTNVAAKKEVVARATELTQNVVDLYDRLQQLRLDINNEIEQKIERINSILERIADVNVKIRTSLVMNSQPNDLIDERDRLLDELSQYANIYYKDRDDGQIDLRIGDKVALSGSEINYMRAVERPFSRGIYELFVGNSKVVITDGEMKALVELRDEIIPKYMQRIDEFVLNLTDKINLIHQEGYDSKGSVTGIPFFEQLGPVTDPDDPRIFRLLGTTKLSNGSINYITGGKDFSDSNPANIQPNLNGNLIFFDGSNVSSVSIDTGDDLQTIMNNINTSGASSWLNIDYQAYDSNYRLYFKGVGGNSLDDKLILDLGNSILRNLGFDYVNFDVVRIGRDSIEDFKTRFSSPQSYRVYGVDIVIDPSDDVNTIMNNIVSAISGASDVTAQIVDVDSDGNSDYIYIIPKSNVDYDIRNVDPADENGFLVDVKAEYTTVAALKNDTPTLDNVLGLDETDAVETGIINNGFDIVINSTTIHIDPVVDTLEDVVQKINDAETGVIADLTPHNSLVFRAGRDYNFDMRNMNIEGPREFWEKVGFISDDGVRDWSANYTLIDRTWDYNDFKSYVDLAKRLEIDKNEADYGLGISYQFSVSSTLSYKPEVLAVDSGKAIDSNGDWIVERIEPIGPSNVDIIQHIANSKFQSILSNGTESFSIFLGSVVAELGVEGETAIKMKSNNELLKFQVDNERERIKGVSLDEEMSNLIKYQQAFNASARVITAVDEMIQRVIDRLGIVGR
jgi:flagellar hook-associated protein 1 FlgK